MLKRISSIKLLKLQTLLMEPEHSTLKTLQNNKKLLDDLVKRRYVYFQGAQIYGGCAGLYDYGPIGCAIKNNIEQLWRDHFVLEEDMLEINTTCITPHTVFENSGHVAKFQDLMVKDVKKGFGFRPDKLISKWIETKLEKDKKKLKEDDILNFKKILTTLDSMEKQQIAAIIKKYQIKSPDTGNELTEPQPCNLMFKTQIGPTSNVAGYLRPQTAQGMFINFNKLLDYNGGRLPFASAQIGLAFRNEISPRGALLRVREFQVAEIEHFVDPENKSHPKFNNIANLQIPILSAKDQEELKDHSWMSIRQAVKDHNIINNETVGYFLGRIYLFLEDCGINVKSHLRFRQHMQKQMAHYAKDCWDAQIETSAGWVECVGCADRSAYDLQHHSAGSGSKLVAARKFKEPIAQQQTSINVQKQVVGKQFKKDSQAINAHLDGLSEESKRKMKEEFETSGSITLDLNNKQFVLDKKHLQFKQQVINVSEQKFVPSVIEPSFGLGRILYSVLEHSFKMRDEKRTYLCLKPKIAPVKVSILPLQGDKIFDKYIVDIRNRLKRNLVSCKVDDSGQSIGRRYSRTDEIGIPFAITIDYDTEKQKTITLRELHTMLQIRIPLDHIQKIVCQLALQQIKWSDVCKEYPAQENKEKDE